MPDPLSMLFAIALAGCLAGADDASSVVRHASALGVSFELPADWIEVAADGADIQRFYPPMCEADGAPVVGCPAFLVLQRLTLEAPLDAEALSTRRAREQARVLRPRASGRHAGSASGSVWRESDYQLGLIQMRLDTTTLTAGSQAWELTGWASPGFADEYAARFRASGASLQQTADAPR
jgi:hypothetical protein